MGGTVLATLVAYAVTANARAGGILDADTLGPTILIAASILVMTDAHLAASISMEAHRRPWQVVVFVGSVTTLALIILAVSTAPLSLGLTFTITASALVSLTVAASGLWRFANEGS
jgi:hypothetical protein